MPHVIAAHHPRPRGTLALALILATALVGCGGGDTHSEFVARLVETCTDHAARTDQLWAELEDRLRAHDYPAASRSMQALSVLATVNWQIRSKIAREYLDGRRAVRAVERSRDGGTGARVST
jgi:hypothetical protein